MSTVYLGITNTDQLLHLYCIVSKEYYFWKDYNTRFSCSEFDM